MKKKLSKILSYNIVILFYMIQNACADSEKISLVYNFNQTKAGIEIEACLYNCSARKVFWLIPKIFEQNQYNKSFKLATDIQSHITPKYDYIDTYASSNKTCISYILEKHKGWYNEYYQDISLNSFSLFAGQSLIIPESVFEEFKNVDVKFNWHNFTKPVYSTLGNVMDSKYYSLILEDFESLFFASGYNVANLDQSSKDKLIYPSNSHSIISNASLALKIVNDFLQKKNLNIESKQNIFIFAQNDFGSAKNPGSAYSNGREFVQIVGVNLGQNWDKSLIRTFVHEYLHKIIGFTIKFKNKKSSDEWWFKEGFTDFLTMQILLETGIWATDDYMKFLNDRIYEYYTFEMHKHKLNDMYSKFMFEEAGYIAGMLYASKLNELIMNSTANSQGLLEFLSNFTTLYINDTNLYFSEN